MRPVLVSRGQTGSRAVRAGQPPVFRARTTVGVRVRRVVIPQIGIMQGIFNTERRGSPFSRQEGSSFYGKIESSESTRRLETRGCCRGCGPPAPGARELLHSEPHRATRCRRRVLRSHGDEQRDFHLHWDQCDSPLPHPRQANTSIRMPTSCCAPAVPTQCASCSLAQSSV